MNALSRRKFLSASAALAAGTFTNRFGFAADGKIDPAKLVAGNTQFGCELYGELKGEAGNLFLSPFSISTALGMAAAGAKGKTLEEMEKTLHLPAEAPAAFGAVLKSLNDEPDAKKRGFTLSTANALWAQHGYPWKPEYKKLVATDYGAGLFDVNYKTDAETARTTINTWVEKETRDKIKDLLPKGSVTALTRLVLTNAIYFKGDWEVKFKKEDTKDLPFTLADGKKVDAPLMHRVGPYSYAETDGYQVLDMPYTGKRVSMTVILPKKPDGLAAVEKELTGDKLGEMLKRLRYEKIVHVHLPKFKVTKSFLLNEPLKALGMRAAFDGADFSGMATAEPLSISAVLHKAFVDVNEEGTEAAAATGIVIGATSVAPPPVVRHFRADRPFLYLIRDHKTGSVLFMGRLSEPAK